MSLKIDKDMLGPFSRAMLEMYAAFCGEPRESVYVPDGFEPLMLLLYERLGYPEPHIMTRGLHLAQPSGGGVVVGFSGGLDSAYMALSLMDAGNDVTLYHVTGLNKAYPDEDVSARAFAREAGMRLVECRVKHVGKERYIDNPLKNQLILALMADWGLPKGVPSYALGSDWCTGISDCEVGYTITDSIEVNRAFQEGTLRHVSDYKLVFIDGDVKKAQRLEYIIENHPTCLPHVSSCISPHRFKGKLHNGNIEKYGVELLDGRCGSCFKCCMEWLLMRKMGAVRQNAAYEAHCWDVLAHGTHSHRKDLFGDAVPMAQREVNLMEYGS